MSQAAEALDDLRFGQKVETPGGFAEEDYTAHGKEVKSTFKARLEPPAPLGHDAHLAQLARPQGADAAGLAEIGVADDEGAGFFERHGRIVAEGPAAPT